MQRREITGSGFSKMRIEEFLAAGPSADRFFDGRNRKKEQMESQFLSCLFFLSLLLFFSRLEWPWPFGRLLYVACIRSDKTCAPGIQSRHHHARWFPIQIMVQKAMVICCERGSIHSLIHTYVRTHIHIYIHTLTQGGLPRCIQSGLCGQTGDNSVVALVRCFVGAPSKGKRRASKC